jgi:hypothetical protein
MRTCLIAVGALCVGLVAGFFIGRGLPSTERSAAVPNPEAQTAPPGEARSYPSKEEVLAYLDGKTVDLAGPNRTSEKAEKPCTLERDQIEALEVEQSSVRINDGPRNTTVTFLLDSDQGRYAVKFWVYYRWVEKKCAFFGFEVKELSKQ